MIFIVTGKGGVGKTTVCVREAFSSKEDCYVVSIDPLHSLLSAAGLEDAKGIQKIKTSTHKMYFLQVIPNIKYIGKSIKLKKQDNEFPYTAYELYATDLIKKLVKNNKKIIIDTDSLGGFLRIRNALEGLDYKIILVSGVNDEVEVFKTNKFIESVDKIEKLVINNYIEGDRKSRVYSKFLNSHLIPCEILYRHPIEPVGPYTLILDKPPSEITKILNEGKFKSLLEPGLPKNTKLGKELLDYLLKIYEQGGKEIYEHPKYEESKIPLKNIYFVVGNGGQGKSTISVALARALSDLGKKVILYNADPYTSLDDVLDIVIPEINIDELIKKEKVKLDDFIYKCDKNIWVFKSFGPYDFVPGFLTMHAFKFIEKAIKNDYIMIVDTPPFGVLKKDFESALPKDWIDDLAYKLLIKFTRNKDKKAFLKDRREYIEEGIELFQKEGHILLVTYPSYTSYKRNYKIYGTLYSTEMLDYEEDRLNVIVNKFDAYPRIEDENGWDSRFDGYGRVVYIPKSNIEKIKEIIKKHIEVNYAEPNNSNI